MNQARLSSLIMGVTMSISLFVAGCGGQPAVTPTAQVAGTSPSPAATPAESIQRPPTNTVETATAPIISPQPSPEDFGSFADSFLTELEKNRRFSGVALIVSNGETILDKSYGYADREQELAHSPQTKYRIASITKQFTAAAILFLQGQGKLDVQDSVCAHLSDCPAAWQPITLHHLLTHTSGIPDYTAGIDFNNVKATSTTPSGIVERFKDKPLEFQPGERWSKSNSGYVLLGQVIERVSGFPYEDYIQQNILTPLGMNDTGFGQNPDNLAVGYWDGTTEADFIDMTNAYSTAGLYTTAGDLYRWGQALYSEQFLQPDLLDLMLAKNVESIPGEFSGYGTFIWELEGHRVFDVGGLIDGFNTSFYYFPDDQVSMILLSNQQDVDTFKLNSILAKEMFGK